MGVGRDWPWDTVGLGIEQPWCDVEIGEVYTYFDTMADATIMAVAPVRIAASINMVIQPRKAGPCFGNVINCS
jgi:hypothetical protein